MDDDKKLTPEQAGVAANPDTNPDLFKGVEEKLRALTAGDLADSPAEVRAAAFASKRKPAAKASDEVEDVVEDETPLDDADESVEQPEGEEAAEEGDPSTPTLPAAHKRSLLAYDWTEDEIAASMKTDPEGTIRIAERVHKSRSAEIAQWADLGRKAQRLEPDSSAIVEQPKFTGQLPTIDVEAMKKKYGDDGMVSEVVAPVNAVISELNKILPGLIESAKSIQSTQAEKVTQDIGSFFTSPDMKAYEAHYGGESLDDLTDEQYQNRFKVAELADAMIAGAAQQGRRLSVTEALGYAHDSLSSKLRAAAIRTEVRGKVAKRNASLSLKPSKSGKAPTSGGKERVATNQAERESNASRRLAAVFGNS